MVGSLMYFSHTAQLTSSARQHRNPATAPGFLLPDATVVFSHEGEHAMHTFFHADRNSSLMAGQHLFVDDRGLSAFGAVYWSQIQSEPPVGSEHAVVREFCAERAMHIVGFPWSRHCSLFAAETIEQAIEFANAIQPTPSHPIPIFEIFAERASRHDMNWLDYEVGMDARIEYACAYWCMDESNHQPAEGPRKPPQWEILIPLPARVGQQVATAFF